MFGLLLGIPVYTATRRRLDDYPDLLNPTGQLAWRKDSGKSPRSGIKKISGGKDA